MRRAALAVSLFAAWACARDSSSARAEEPADLTARVDAAIDAGCKWLLQQRKDDGWPLNGFEGGSTALAYHTLRACRLPADEPGVAAAFKTVAKDYDRLRPRQKGGISGLRTYTAALYAMCFADHGKPAAEADNSGERPIVLDAEDAARMTELVRFFEDTQDEKGRWWYGYEGKGDARRFDNSNVQYALLGLKAASRCGVKARRETWTRSLRHFVETQQRYPDREAAGGRGWDYDKDASSTGKADASMTAGGVGSLVICRSELLGDPKYQAVLDAKAERAVREGLAWLAPRLDRSFSLRGARNYGWSTWQSYEVYAIERAAVLAGVDRIGGRDWYREGAQFLVDFQSKDGAWSGETPLDKDFVRHRPSPSDVCVSTCFALLFLARGIAPVARGALTQAADDTDINFAVASTLSDKDFEDFVDLVLSRRRRATDPAVKERLFAKATAVGPRIVVPLIRRLELSKEEERESAAALLKHATGLDHGPAPAAAAKWREWLAANEGKLRYDAERKRIVAE
jgi:hypothetical protein